MTDTPTKKRSEELAIENVKRIADLLRTERNDAIALAQVRREEANRYRNLVLEAGRLLEAVQGVALPDSLAARIGTFIASIPRDERA